MIPERERVRDLAKEGIAFLSSHKWCQEVTEVRLAFAVAPSELPIPRAGKF
jgi:hypothetical protein